MPPKDHLPAPHTPLARPHGPRELPTPHAPRASAPRTTCQRPMSTFDLTRAQPDVSAIEADPSSSAPPQTEHYSSAQIAWLKDMEARARMHRCAVCETSFCFGDFVVFAISHVETCLVSLCAFPSAT
eukprot:3767481-Pleurochrysis_carterae.AAC.1